MADHRLAFTHYRPSRVVHDRPLVIVHGKRGNAIELVGTFREVADRVGIELLAPDFSGRNWRGFQWLAGANGPFAALHAFEAMLGALPTDVLRPGSPIDLFGFSGGAQFVHRFAMLRPERIGHLIVAAAGWYSELDPGRRFPEGVGEIPFAQKSRDFLALPIHVAVGQNDVRRSSNLRTGTDLDERQGRNRLERARFWFEHVRHAAKAENLIADMTFSVLPGCAHNLTTAMTRGGLADLVASALAPKVDRTETKAGNRTLLDVVEGQRRTSSDPTREKRTERGIFGLELRSCRHR